MAGLLKNVTNSIWHAFMALHQEPEGMVNKTKLKVDFSIYYLQNEFIFLIYTMIIGVNC